MKIILSHAQNGDLMHGQGDGSGYWNPPLDPKRTVKTCASIAKASGILTDWVRRNGLGGGNMARDCGNVLDDKGRLIARISYNGRAWHPTIIGKEITF